MQTLMDIYDHLTHGELVQVYTGQERDDFGCLSEDTLYRLWSSVQLGLTALHKRFLLREGSLILAYDGSRNTFVIDKKYAQSNTESAEPVKYILDTTSPFQDDLLRIEQVFNPEDIEQLLNVEGNADSFQTTDYRTLKVPLLYEGETLRVNYRANHPAVDKNTAQSSPSSVTIELPPSHLEPLLYFVAARVTTPIGMVADHHEGNSYLRKYENACRQLEDWNYQTDLSRDSTRLERNGWV